MEKTKELPKIKENGKKEDKMTVAKAIEILENEIPQDRYKLAKKEGALEVLKQIDQMPSFLTQAFSSYFKRILQFGHAGNNGTPTATTNIEAGDGVATALNLSDDVLSVQPQTDDTTGAFLVKDQGGSNILAVDTSGTGTGSSAKGRVLLGRSQVIANTQYAHFGGAYDSSLYNAVADTHYAIPFNFNFFDALQAMGSSTSSSFSTQPEGTSELQNSAEVPAPRPSPSPSS